MTKICLNAEFDSLAEFSSFIASTSFGVVNGGVVQPKIQSVVTGGPASEPQPIDNTGNLIPTPRKRRTKAEMESGTTPVEEPDSDPVQTPREAEVSAPVDAAELKEKAYQKLRDVAKERGMEYARTFLAEYFDTDKFSALKASQYDEFLEKAEEDLKNGPLLKQADILK